MTNPGIPRCGKDGFSALPIRMEGEALGTGGLRGWPVFRNYMKLKDFLCLSRVVAASTECAARGGFGARFGSRPGVPERECTL